MNERINELERQAIIWCDENIPDADGYYGEVWEDKFAELIVQECVAICNRRAEVLQNHLDEHGKNMAEEPRVFTQGAISGSLRNAQSIRQHFEIDV